MNSPHKRPLLEAYTRGYSDLQQALRDFPSEMWVFKPSPTSWSIHEIIIHLGDTEVQSHVRFRTIISEPSSTIPCYDEYKWSEVLSYNSQDAQMALAIIKLMRESNTALLSSLASHAWNNIGIHSVRGPESVEGLVKGYTRHLHQHISQMTRCYQAWQARQGRL